MGMPGMGMPAMGMPAMGMPAMGMPAMGMPGMGMGLGPAGGGGRDMAQAFGQMGQALQQQQAMMAAMMGGMGQAMGTGTGSGFPRAAAGYPFAPVASGASPAVPIILPSGSHTATRCC